MGVMALIVLPIFMLLSANMIKQSDNYEDRGIKKAGRYLILGTAILILIADLLIILNWIGLLF